MGLITQNILVENAIIQIRTSNSNVAPINLANGELAYSFVSNTMYIGGPNNNIINLFEGVLPGNGTVTNVITGLGLAGGPITGIGTITANIANVTQQGVTKLIDSISSTDTANAATANSVSWINTIAEDAYGQANAATILANTANNTANASYSQTNVTNTLATSANTLATTANTTATASYNKANSAANTVMLSANSGSTSNDTQINFINTLTTNIALSTGTGSNTNVAIAANQAAILSGIVTANASNIAVTYEANGQVQVDYRGSGGNYEVDVYANGSLVLANANLNFNNTVTTNVSATANGAKQVNVAWTTNGSAIVASGNTSNIAITPEANGQMQIDTRFAPGTTPPGGSNTQVQFANNGVFGGTANLTFNINGNVMNVWSMNVTQNIANTGNLLVTQNTITGNLSVTQNVTTSNLSVTALANLVNLNVSANIANVGNLAVTQNAVIGNLSITQNVTLGNAIVSSNIKLANGNITLGTNTAQGYIILANTGNANVTNLNVTSNIANVGNLLVTQNIVTGNLNVITLATIGTLDVTAINSPNLNAAYSTANVANTLANTANNTANASYFQANISANTVMVSANSGSTQNAAELNFINTAFSNVAIVAGTGSNANVSITPNAAAILSGIITANSSNISVTYDANGNVQVDTRAAPGSTPPGGSNTQVQFANNGVFGGTSNLTFDINANILNVWAVDVTSNLSAGNINLGTNTAQGYIVIANTGNANVTNLNVSTLATIGTLDVGAINSPNLNAAYTQANSAYAQANLAYTQAYLAYVQANIAYTQANNQGTFADGIQVVANVANINFKNTATINVSIVPNGIQTNSAFSVNTSAVIASGNTSNITVTYESNGQAQLDTRSLTSVPGSNQELVFNNGGAFGAEANLTWNYATKTLALGNTTHISSVVISSQANTNGSSNLTFTTSQATFNGPAGNLNFIANDSVGTNVSVGAGLYLKSGNSSVGGIFGGNITLQTGLGGVGNQSPGVVTIALGQNVLYTAQTVFTIDGFESTSNSGQPYTCFFQSTNANTSYIGAILLNDKGTGPILGVTGSQSGNNAFLFGMPQGSGFIDLNGVNLYFGDTDSADIIFGYIDRLTGNLNWSNGNVVVSSNIYTGNLTATQNILAGNITSLVLDVTTINSPLINAVYAAANSAANGVMISANSGSTANSSELNFINTAFSNVSVTSGAGSNANVAIIPNVAAVLAGVITGNTSNISITYDASGNVEVDTRAPPGATPPGGSNTQVQFANNGVFGGTSNLEFNLNGNVLSAWSVAVTQNIANTGNILVSQNVFTGNVIAYQNVIAGNVIITQNAVISNGNVIVGSNTAQGYIMLANTGNATITNLNIINEIVTQNIILSNGNISLGTNTAQGYILIANTGNVNVTNLNVSSLAFIGTLDVTAINSPNLNAAYSQANSAANTVMISANSGSTKNAVELNFVNTTLSNVAVVTGSGSNANIGITPNAAAILSGIITGNTSNIFVTYLSNGNVAIDTLLPNQMGILAGVVTANSSNIAIAYESNGQIQIDTRVTGTGGGGGGNTAILQDQIFTATANQTVFTLSSNAYSNTYTIVIINGLMQPPTTAYGVVNNTITLLSNSSAGDIVEVKYFTDSEAIIFNDNFTATTNQSVFTLSQNAISNNYTIVAVNGLIQPPTLAYGVSNATLTFVSNTTVGDIVDVMYFVNTLFLSGSGGGGSGITPPGGSNTDIQFANNGVFGGTSNLTYNMTTNTMNVWAVNVTSNLSVGNVSVTTNLIVGNPITQFANNGVYVAGVLVANNPNINFVAANTSNLSIVGTSNTSPGNVTITLDTRVPPGSGGGGGNYEVDLYANGTSVLTNANLNFNNTATVSVLAVANGVHQANISFNTSIATTSVVGSTLLIDSITTLDTGNAATANAVAWANSIAQTALVLAANAYILANVSDSVAQTALVLAANAFLLANELNTPQGSNTDIQFNNNGIYGGSPNLTFNLATNTMNVSLMNCSSNANFGNLTISGFEQGPGLFANGIAIVANGGYGITADFLQANILLTLPGSDRAPALTFNSQTSSGLAITAEYFSPYVANSIIMMSQGNAIMSWSQTSINIGGYQDLITPISCAPTLNVYGNIVAANVTVNSISFIPSWTSATLNTSYTTISNYNPPSFWTDPFGIVHVRGVMKPTSNLSLSAVTNVNVANGFPVPANISTWASIGANDTLLGTNTSLLLQAAIYTNGALQFTNELLPAGNLAFASIDGFVYSHIG